MYHGRKPQPLCVHMGMYLGRDQEKDQKTGHDQGYGRLREFDHQGDSDVRAILQLMRAPIRIPDEREHKNSRQEPKDGTEGDHKPIYHEDGWGARPLLGPGPGVDWAQ